MFGDPNFQVRRAEIPKSRSKIKIKIKINMGLNNKGGARGGPAQNNGRARGRAKKLFAGMRLCFASSSTLIMSIHACALFSSGFQSVAWTARGLHQIGIGGVPT